MHWHVKYQIKINLKQRLGVDLLWNESISIKELYQIAYQESLGKLKLHDAKVVKKF